MALARVERLTFAYPEAARPALRDVSLTVDGGEVVLVLGASGSGKSTLLRALNGLVPHFHGGRFEGRVEVDGLDTRRHRPAELAGRVASVFQDPEDQVVMTHVENEVAFGLENLGVPSGEIRPRAEAALAAVGAGQLRGQPVATVSAGELQRVTLASALALEPRLLVLDEPSSQLDPTAADAFLGLVRDRADRGTAVVLAEQRPTGPLEICDRVVFVEGGHVTLDRPRDDAVAWLAQEHPLFAPRMPASLPESEPDGEVVCALDDVSFAYAGGPPVLTGTTLTLRRGEIAALTGPNGCGKTTLAKLATGLLEPAGGHVGRHGRATYLSQDPGRYLACDRLDAEVALGAGGDRGRARDVLAQVGLAGLEARHPRDLSSGERERLALAAVLVTDPDLLVLDEPTRGVDPDWKAALAALVRQQAGSRATLVVTHDLLFAGEAADREIALARVEERLYA